MKAIKWLGVSLLSFLLFLSLSAFGTALALNSTLLNPDFVVRELGKLDKYSLARNWVDQQALQLGIDPRYQPYLTKALDTTFADLTPWADGQINVAVHTVYDYFLGRSQRIDLVVSLEPVRDSLKQNLKNAVLASPPPELQGLPPAAIDAYLNQQINPEVNAAIPPSLTFDWATLDPATKATLGEARQAIADFQLGYKLMIAFILLLILGIVLIIREVKGVTRTLGITLLTSGVFIYLGNLVTKALVRAQITNLATPVELQRWLPQVLTDVLTPLDIYGIVLAAIGILLLIVSLVYRTRQTI